MLGKIQQEMLPTCEIKHKAFSGPRNKPYRNSAAKIIQEVRIYPKSAAEPGRTFYVMHERCNSEGIMDSSSMVSESHRGKAAYGRVVPSSDPAKDHEMP